MLAELGGFVAGAVSGDVLTGWIRPTTLENPRTHLTLLLGIVPPAGLVVAHQVGLIDPSMELANTAVSSTLGYYGGALIRLVRNDPALARAFVRAIIHR